MNSALQVRSNSFNSMAVVAGGGFMVRMHSKNRKGSFHEPQSAAGILPTEESEESSADETSAAPCSASPIRLSPRHHALVRNAVSDGVARCLPLARRQQSKLDTIVVLKLHPRARLMRNEPRQLSNIVGQSPLASTKSVGPKGNVHRPPGHVLRNGVGNIVGLTVGHAPTQKQSGYAKR